MMVLKEYEMIFFLEKDFRLKRWFKIGRPQRQRPPPPHVHQRPHTPYTPLPLECGRPL